MAQEITIGSSGVFTPTSLEVSQSYTLSAATSPLVLTPPQGKVIRLDYLGIDGATGSLNDTSISIDGSGVISGILTTNTRLSNRFQVGRSAYSDASVNASASAGYKEPLVAFSKDQSISISTLDDTGEDIVYSVSYGDL